MTPNIEARLEETSFTLPHRTQNPQKTTAPDPKNWRMGLPSLVRLWVAEVPFPLRALEVSYENALYKFTFDIDKFDIGHP